MNTAHALKTARILARKSRASFELELERETGRLTIAATRLPVFPSIFAICTQAYEAPMVIGLLEQTKLYDALVEALEARVAKRAA